MTEATPVAGSAPSARDEGAAEPGFPVRALPAGEAILPPPRLWRLATGQGMVALRSVAVFLLLWEGVALWTDSPIQLPTPLRVASALVDLARDGDLLDNAVVSVERLAGSLALAVLIAVPLGFLIGLDRRAEALIDPLVELLRPISGIAWIPLGLFIFGVGDALPVFILVYVAFFQLLINTVAGVKAVDPKLVAAARTMGIRRGVILRKAVLPAALPSITVGFRLAFAVKLACKDVHLAEAQGFTALVGRGAQKTMEDAMAMGLADRDTAALMRLREDQLGVRVRPAAAIPADSAATTAA